MIKYIKLLLAKLHRRRMAKKINKALDIKLHAWQIKIIFPIPPETFEVPAARCLGKTLTRCIGFCMSNGRPIDLRRPILNAWDTNVLAMWADEDAGPFFRLMYFRDKLRRVHEKLNAAGIKTRTIYFDDDTKNAQEGKRAGLLIRDEFATKDEEELS